MKKTKSSLFVDHSPSPTTPPTQPTSVTERQFRAITLGVIINALSAEFYDAFPEDGKGLRFEMKEAWKRAKSALRNLLATKNEYASWQDQQAIDTWTDGVRPAIKLALRMSDEQLVKWLEIGEQMATDDAQKV